MNSELTFVDRLKHVMGEEKYTPWAKRHGLSPVTVLGWLNNGMLYPKSWKKLEEATGISKDWWLHGSLDELKDTKYQQSQDTEHLELNQETLQYDQFKVYRENVVKLNAKPRVWLEDIVNYFVSLPEQEQEKISIYSKDLYEKVTNKSLNKHVNVTISGIVEVPIVDKGGNNDTRKAGKKRR